MTKKYLTKIVIILFTGLVLSFLPFSYQQNPNLDSNITLSSQPTVIVSQASATNSIEQGLQAQGSNQPWVISLWRFSLNLINILLIGILIFLGVVNILHINYDTYQLKKYLLPLIIAVILANFSLFICRAINDFSYAISGQVMQDSQIIIKNIQSGLLLNTDNVITWVSNFTGSNPLASAGLSVAAMMLSIFFGLIVGLILLIVMWLLSIILYLRVYLVLLLAGIAPIAFIFMVLPATQNLFKQWWTWFLRFVFMGPLIAIVLKVASVIGSSVTPSTTGTSSNFVVLIVIISLIGLAAFIPFILGGVVFSKIGNFAKGIAGYAVDNTMFGRSVKGMIGGPLAKKKQDLEAQEQRMGAATTRGLDVLNTSFDPRLAMREGKNAYTQMEEQSALQGKLKYSLQNQVDFQKQFEDKNWNALKDVEKQALLKQGADNGWLNKEQIEKLYQTKGIDDSLRHAIINSNNEARLKNNQAIIPVNSLTSISDSNKLDYLKNGISSYDKNYSSAQTSYARNNVRAQALDQISAFVDKYKTMNAQEKADNKTMYTNAQNIFNQISSDVERGNDGAARLKSNTIYTKLSSNSGFSKIADYRKLAASMSANTQAQNNAFDFISSQHHLNDLAPNIKTEKMKDMIIGNQSIKKQMAAASVRDFNNQGEVESFFNGKFASLNPSGAPTTESKKLAKQATDNFLHNNKELTTYDIYRQQIHDDLDSQGIFGKI